MNCYGPIPEMWGEMVRGILGEIDMNQGRLTPEVIVCAALLTEVSERRMEDMRWVEMLKTRLQDLRVGLRNSGGSWTQKALRLTQDFIQELGGS
jgi:hypothetical protein